MPRARGGERERERDGRLADAPLAGDEHQPLVESKPGLHTVAIIAGEGKAPVRANKRERWDFSIADHAPKMTDGRASEAGREPTSRSPRRALEAATAPPAVAAKPCPSPKPSSCPSREPEPDRPRPARRSAEATGSPSRRRRASVRSPGRRVGPRAERRGAADHRQRGDRPAARRGGRPSAGAEEPARAKVISFANQKGGVAKTTTTLNLAVAFAESGHEVLCIDLDPQGNLTMSQGIDPDKVEKSMFDVLVHHIPIREVIQHARDRHRGRLDRPRRRRDRDVDPDRPRALAREGARRRSPTTTTSSASTPRRASAC